MQPQEQPVIKIGGLEIRYLMDGTETGAGSGMFELTVAPGARVPPAHSHSNNEEIVYVLEGRLRYSVDGEMRDLTPGERMYSPRNSVHAFSNPHDRPARALVDSHARHRRPVFPRYRRGRRRAGRPRPGQDGGGDDPLRPGAGTAACG